MTIVNVTQEQQPLKYLVITQQKDPESLITTRVLISDNRTNKISLVSIEKGVGIEGKRGPTGLQGPAGKDGVVFEILPISSGGTNNTTFTNDKIIYYDGNSLTSSNYSINELINSTNAITGIIAGTGLSKITNGNSVTINTNLGDGLTVTASKITVDDTIARKSELNLEDILNGGKLSIVQGGTNNDSYVGNRLLYYDGTKIASFPLQTGLIVLSGTKINIVAGSGLIGGGDVSLPNGSVVLNIGSSSDIVVEENTISLSNTGTPGTYSKITTDSKGRVISGGSILNSDILSALGYTPWHSGNDGSGSKLDADFLDGLDSSYFLNFYNLTGTINTDILPIQVASGTYSKVKVNNKGLVIDGQSIGYSDVVNALNYVPLSTSGGMISGSLVVRDKTVLSGLIVKDNLPMFGYNNREILPSYPRGFQFQYGGRTSNSKTGVLAYYPVDQELRLITDISIDDGVLDGGGSDDAYIDDVDGGNANSVYVIGSYQGTTGVVLLRHVADQRYVSIENNQSINGSKTFTNRLTAYDGIDILPKQTITKPPLYVANNSGLVINFNADLLDGNHGNFYRNAVNLTGVLKYNSKGISGVLISNLSGTPKYIAKFDNRSSNPSATVSDSLLFEENNTIIVDQQGNLCIGTGNVFQSGSSLAVGIGNQIYSNNSLAVGFENIVLQDNSVSIGTNASGWIKNQVSFGAFRVVDDSNNQSKGQYSTVAMYLDADNGQGDAWVDMKPKIIIPQNKTMAYNAEILMNKVGGTGVAYILFNSGIITKRTISDDNFQPINITKIVQNPVKNEIFNDSQNKKHYYIFNVPTNNSDGSSTKFINIKPPPLEYTPLSGQNIEPSYKYKREFVTCTGTFIKTHDGLLDVIIEKPIYTGWHTQNLFSNLLNIKSYDHNMVSGCLVKLMFSSSSGYQPISEWRSVSTILDKDNFTVKDTAWEGYIYDDLIILDKEHLQKINNKAYSIDEDYTSYRFNNTNEFLIDIPLSSVYDKIITKSQIFTTGFLGSVSETIGLIVDGFDPGETFASGTPVLIYPLSNNSGDLTLHQKRSYSGIYTKTNLLQDYKINGYYKTDISGNITIYSEPVPNKFNTLNNLSPHCPYQTTLVPGLGDNDNTKLSIVNNQLYINDYSQKTMTSRMRISSLAHSGIFIEEPIIIDSLKQHINVSVVEKTLGYNPQVNPSVLDVFSVKDHINGSYTRNTNCWLYGLDLTPFSPWNSRYGEGAAGTLISSRHVLFCHHLDFWPLPGDTIRFIGQDNSVYNRTIASTGYVQGLDFSIGFLDSELPSDISPIKILPTNFLDQIYMSPTSGIPVVYLNQQEKSAIGMGYWSDISGSEIYINTDNISQFLPPLIHFTGGSIIGGDSANPIFTILNDEIILLATMYNPGAGPSVSKHKNAIDAIMTGLSTNINDQLIISDIANNFSTSSLSLQREYSIEHDQSLISPLSETIFYRPYIEYQPSSNNFYGSVTSGSKVIKDCFHNTYLIDNINNISLSSALPSIGTIFKNIELTGTKVIRARQSPVISGYMSSGSYIMSGITLNTYNLLTGSTFSNDLFLYSGVQFFHTNSNYSGTIIQAININSPNLEILFNQPFNANGYTNSSQQTIFMSGVGFQVILDTPYSGQSNNNISIFTENGTPPNNHYTPNSLLLNNNAYYGFNTINTGVLVDGTGLVSFYTRPIPVPVSIDIDNENIFDSLNTESMGREKTIYLKFLTTGTGSLLANRPYNINTNQLDNIFLETYPNQATRFDYYPGTGSNGYDVFDNNYSYYPDNTGICHATTGLVYINLDKNHGFKILNNDIINQLPVKFTHTVNCPSNRLPIDNLFSIDSISVNKISVKDSDNYILKPTAGPDYFEQPISAIYNISGLPNEIKITGVGVPRLYVNTDDIIKIVDWNGAQPTNRLMYNYIKINSIDNNLNSINCIPISDTGLLGLSPYSLPDEFGTLKFVCVSSGFCDIPISNNIYYHSYGGSSSSYPLDSDGKFVNAPQTGIYTISSNSSSCSSGTLCVNIVGFGGTVFSNIQDIIPRTNIGKTSNITSDSKGYVRPWGNNQKFYFDFSDGNSALNGAYYINDKLDNNIITISIPYKEDIIDTSGLVYIIDSNENIKSNLNPNKDNLFIVSDKNINGASTIKDYEIKSFNKNTRRWKHLVHLKNDPSIAYDSHPFSVGPDNSIIHNFSSDNIIIPSTGISYSLDSQTYISVTGDNMITIPNDTSSVFLKIKTTNGAKKWDANTARSAPKINISGLTNYIIANNNINDYITFSETEQQWTIPVTINQLQSTYNNRPIAITVGDEAGSYTKDLFLNTQYIPRIYNPINKFLNNIAGYVNKDDNGSSWFLTFDTKYYDPSQHSLSILNYPGTGTPSSGYDPDTKTLRFYHNYDSPNGIYNTVVNLSKDGTILSTATGAVLVCDSSSLPSYATIFDGLDDEIYLDATNTNTPSFSFYIPTASNNPSNATIPSQNIQPASVTSGYSSSFSINGSVTDVTQKGYKCTLTLSNVYVGRYPMSIAFDVTQRTPAGTNATFSFSKNININIYKQISIDQVGMFFPIVSDIQQPWSVSFKIQNGICGIDQSKPPNISLSNLPIIGNYTSQPLEYNIDKTYNGINKNWNIVVSGKKDINEIYTNYTGIWPISILAQDQFNSSSVTNNLLFMEYPYIENVLNTYGTPNNSYFTMIDIKQSNNNMPAIDINSQESTAHLYNTNYKKYDRNLKLWEYAYSGGPMVDKWDSQILLNNQTSELQIQCKGMGDDKVYGVCKLNLIELDTVGLAKIPLRIIDLNSNYPTTDGSAWKIEFKTEYGLADRLYPPRILLSGLPTSCAGFNPPLSQSQAACCISPEYDNGKWKYEFNGIPLCFQAGNVYNFVIRAFDTVDGTQILGSAIAYSKITYTELDDHPSPTYGGTDNIELYPYPFSQPSVCKTYVYEPGYFGTVSRQICPIPTGLKSWSISGSVPPGLNYQIVYTGVKGPDGFPAFPYSEASVSGQLIISGFPTTFPPNGNSTYDEKLTLTFTDGRDKVGTKEIKFTDMTNPAAEPLVDFTIYFDNVKPVYTPGTGTKIIASQNQKVYQPPANAVSLLPESLFSTNNLNIFNFNYSKNGSNIIISGNNISAGISYCSFNNNTNNNGVYSLSGLDDGVGYQLIPDPVGSPALNPTGFGRLSISSIEDVDMKDLPFFVGGNITASTKYGIVGCGRIFDNPDTKNPNKGIMGRVKPSIIATLKENGIFSSVENMPTGTGLSYSYINGSPEISLIQSTNCYETGYFRISGIVVPKLGIFAPDAPPTKNNFSPYDFTHINSNEAVGIDSYYGPIFSREDNRRSLTIFYSLTDILSNTGYISSSITSNSDSTINFEGNDYQTASVFSLFLYNQPDIFPTYDIQSIPYSENEYFWIHKSGNPGDTPSDSSFPPVIVTGVKSPISCMSGQNISTLNYSFKAIGGYVPAEDQGDNVANYDISNYPPYVTGIVQRSLLDSASGAIYSYEEFYDAGTSLLTGSKITIKNCDSLVDKSPYYINFYRDTSINNNMELMYSTGLIFNSGALSGNNLELNLDYAPITPDANNQLLDRQLILNPSVIATTGSDPHYIYLQHNNIPFTTGASIDLLFNHEKQSSSAINLFNNDIFDMLTIISGSEYEITGYCPNPNFISQTGYCGLRQNYHNQIRISNIQYDSPGFWSFALTGVPTGLYKDYIYKIITQENIAPYQNWSPPLTSKKYTTEYLLQITKPIRILNTSLSSSANSWILTFDIDGGSRPVAYNFPEISINGSGCIFDTQNITSYTQTEPLKYKYPYNPITDRLEVTLSSNSNIIDWSDAGLKNQSLNLTVADDISSFTTGIIFMST